MTEKTSNEPNTSFFELMPHSQIPVVDDGSRERAYRRIKRGVTLGVVAVMFQGSSAALTSAWADGCVDNPTYCVTTDQDTVAGSLRSAVVTANGSGASSSTIGFADQLFGIVRDSSGTVTSSTNNYQNPVVITLDSTLEIRTNLIITAPTFDTSFQNLTIQRGLTVAAGDPLISINTPSPETGLVVNGASGQVQIENITIQSRANTANPLDASGNFATPGVAIQVASTIISSPSGDNVATPEVVLKSTNVLNAVSESGGAAVNTPGDVRVEHSALNGNKAVTPNGGTPTDGGAINAGGTVTVVSSTLDNNQASGNGGAISAATVSVTTDSVLAVGSQLSANSAVISGGAIYASGAVTVEGASVSQNQAGIGGAVSAQGSVTIVSSSVTSNQAVLSGGAIHSNDTVSAASSTIRSNIAGSSGGAIAAGSNVSISSDTSITNNSAGGNGGAIQSYGTVSIESSRLQSNKATGNGGAVSATSDVTVSDNSLMQTNSAGGNGGAVSTGGTVAVTTTMILANKAGVAPNGEVTTTGGDGGAIHAVGNVTVNNVVILNNQAKTGTAEGSVTGNGGAIASSATVAIDNARIDANTATNNGGAIAAGTAVTVSSTDSSIISGTSLSYNSAGGDGGAIAAGANVTVSDTNFSDNTAGYSASSDSQTTTGGDGGAIHAVGNVTVNNVTMTNNQAKTGTAEGSVTGNGGAIASSATVAIDNATIVNNSATNNGGAILAATAVTVSSTAPREEGGTVLGGNSAERNGGAIASQGTVTVDATLLAMNSAGGNGGAISAVTTVTVSGSEVSDNTAGYSASTDAQTASGGSGGAIQTHGNVNVSNTTINHNSAFGGSESSAAGQGGAIYAGGDASITNSTLTLNVAASDGGAVNAQSVTASGSTFQGNETAGSGGAVYASGSATITDSDFTIHQRSNPNYNPLIEVVANPAYSPEPEMLNPDYNPLITVPNPDFNPVVGTEPNPVYVDVPIEIPNPACTTDYSVIWDGQCFHNLGDDYWWSLGGRPRFPYMIANPAYMGPAMLDVLRDPSKPLNLIATILLLERPDAPQNNDVYVHNPANDLPQTLDILQYPERERNEDEFTFSTNYATDAGGAVYAKEITIDHSLFQENVANVGGSVYSYDITSDVTVTNSQFLGNYTQGDGGAIYAEGDVTVTDSLFGIKTELIDETLSISSLQVNSANMGQGGAIYSQGDVVATRSSFAGNTSGGAGGAIYSEGGANIDGSLFFLNQANGDGGAIYSVGGVTVENGTTFFANQAGSVNFFGWEGLYPTLYPIFLPGDPEVYLPGGNGGAIYSENSVTVLGSTIGVTAPPESIVPTQAWSNRALCTGYWSPESDYEEWIPECSRYNEVSDEWFYLGDGGGIYARGAVIIEDGESDRQFNLNNSLMGWKSVDDQPSLLTNNLAESDGGAIYAASGITVTNSYFGSIPEINSNYNPGRWIQNPDYIAERTIPNPDFNISVPSRLPNPSYVEGAPSQISNPDCTGAAMFVGNLNTNENWCVINEIWFPLYIQNPESIIDFANPLYDDRQTLTLPAIGDVEIYALDDLSGVEDNFKFQYLGNTARGAGGAIFVVGPTVIQGSVFAGNNSTRDGGAINSEGSLKIDDTSFLRNQSGDDGGAVESSPGEGDLFISRSSFEENVSMDDGGALRVLIDGPLNYNVAILSSIFRANEAFGDGGAIDSNSEVTVLILNTFDDNYSTYGLALDLIDGVLTGNVMYGSQTNPAQTSTGLCSASTNLSGFNFAMDETCFNPEFVESFPNMILAETEIRDPDPILNLPLGYGAYLLDAQNSPALLYREFPSELNPQGVLSELGVFLTDNLDKDFVGANRDATVPWTAGHLQLTFPVTNSPVQDNPEVNNENQNQNQIVMPPVSDNQDSPILILGPVLSAEELARLAQLRAEQLAAELARQQAAEKAAAERLAKIKADKLAREKARALAAEKRRAQLAALKAKIAATQARGEALKKKPSWINLMKNSATPKVVKKLVVSPAK